jgi:hypothetical protein
MGAIFLAAVTFASLDAPGASANSISRTTSYVSAARNQYIAEGFVGGSALQGAPLAVAIWNLQRAALRSSAGRRASIEQAISTINSLGSLPDAMDSPQQTQLGEQDQAALNRFFGLPASGLNGDLPSGQAYITASTVWLTQFGQSGIMSSLKSRPLAEVIGDLDRGFRTTSRGTEYFPAVIEDLRDLSHRVQQPSSKTPPPYAAEMAFLNDFFGFACTELTLSSGMSVARDHGCYRN